MHEFEPQEPPPKPAGEKEHLTEVTRRTVAKMRRENRKVNSIRAAVLGGDLALLSKVIAPSAHPVLFTVGLTILGLSLAVLAYTHFTG